VSRVRIGAVGAGWWATSNHFPILAGRADVELVGVCGKGPSLDVVQRQFGFGMATEDYDELLDQNLDAVIITTPHDLHYDNAVAAIERGLHVQVEKPTTLEPRAAWDLVERVERKGVHFLVPYGWNYKPFTVAAKRMLDAGRSVSDISRALGYASDEGFSRAFRRRTGMTPSSWRLAHRTPVSA